MNLGFRPGLRPPTTVDYEAMKRNALHDQGLLVISVDDPRLSWPQREMLRQIGEKIYGRPRAQERSNGRKG
ncbi:hypothetical protein MPL3356_60499 [Mesorhizobium plurifarium]|uniref:Uncharacterized protein n=1 Tax=Mesorhizobium plurifarium TaxID=69974 RepID=A0A090E9T5_MESPL|nr:hypothetical protein MPL3356_60499 [Mesorhizobium plurifarium]